MGERILPLSPVPKPQSKSVRRFSLAARSLSGASRGLRLAALSRACDWACLLDPRSVDFDRLPWRALRHRCAGRNGVRRRRDPDRRIHLPPKGQGDGCGYACHTLRMITRASLSGSWWDGTRTLTTSAAMKRTSECLAASSCVKTTCDWPPVGMWLWLEFTSAKSKMFEPTCSLIVRK